MQTSTTHCTQLKLVQTVSEWIACIVIWAATSALLLAIVAVLFSPAE